MTTTVSPRKILFACIPFDGHFSPLTGLALELKKAGYDVRWYTGHQYADKIERMGIPYFPFRHALEVNASNLDKIFPERQRYTSQVARLKFDLENVFIRRSTEFYEDIKTIRNTFAFDVMIADAAFTAIPFVKEKLNVPVLAINVFPLMETSKDLAPYGLGMTPSTSFWGKRKQDILRFVSNTILFRKPNQLMRKILLANGINPGEGNIFDLPIRKSSLALQSGTPGFEYRRSDMSANIRFIGPLLPATSSRKSAIDWKQKTKTYKKVILVTQGTVEKDVEKIIAPTLEAFRDTPYLVIATTGGSKTAALRSRFPNDNFIIEDFIPFDEVMPYANVYITNGGYGGVMLGIKHKLPLVVAGVHEGKNEINARVGYFKLGVNLNTENPTSAMLFDSVEEIFKNGGYLKNVRNLGEEFQQYDAKELIVQYVEQVLDPMFNAKGIGRSYVPVRTGLSRVAMAYSK